MTSGINKDLLTACFYGKYDDCVELIAQGADINCHCRFATPLLWTIIGCPPTMDRLKIIQLLFNKGLNINNVDHYLHHAINNSHKFDNDERVIEKIVKLMLPKIKGWATYDFSEWHEDCAKEQERLLTIQRVLHKTPLPMDTQRYLCEWI